MRRIFVGGRRPRLPRFESPFDKLRMTDELGQWRSRIMNLMRMTFTIALLICLACSKSSKNTLNSSRVVEENVNAGSVVRTVPDIETAVRIAEEIWLPIFGKSIYDHLPFQAVLIKDSIWHVFGTMPTGWAGGVPNAEIQKKDAKVLKVWHEQ